MQLEFDESQKRRQLLMERNQCVATFWTADAVRTWVHESVVLIPDIHTCGAVEKESGGREAEGAPCQAGKLQPIIMNN